MAKTYNIKQLQGFCQLLYNTYLKLPAKIGRKFEDVYLCIDCNRMYEQEETCLCGKQKAIPKKKRQKKQKNKSFGIPSAIKLYKLGIK